MSPPRKDKRRGDPATQLVASTRLNAAPHGSADLLALSVGMCRRCVSDVCVFCARTWRSSVSYACLCERRNESVESPGVQLAFIPPSGGRVDAAVNTRVCASHTCGVHAVSKTKTLPPAQHPLSHSARLALSSPRRHAQVSH